MRVSGIVAAVVILLAGPACAQDAPSGEQMALAERFLELSQGDAMAEAIKNQIVPTTQTYIRLEAQGAQSST